MAKAAHQFRYDWRSRPVPYCLESTQTTHRVSYLRAKERFEHLVAKDRSWIRMDTGETRSIHIPDP